MVCIRVEAYGLDSTGIQGASRQHGGAKENGPQSAGKSRDGSNIKLHMVAAHARTAVAVIVGLGIYVIFAIFLHRWLIGVPVMG